MGTIYLNYCGISPLRPTAFEAEQAYSRRHMEAGAGLFREYPDVLGTFRNTAARLFSCQPADVSYTDNTAQGINFIANGYPFRRGDQIISYVHEYPANHYPWVLQQGRGAELVLLPDAEAGGRYPQADLPRAFSFGDLERLVTSRTRIVALSHVQFTSGFAADLAAIGAFCRERGIDLVVDAAQSLGAMPLEPEKLGISALAASGWKWLCGPVGSAVLYTSAALRDKLSITAAGAELMQQGEDYLNHAWNPFSDGRRFEYSTMPIGPAVGLEAAIREVVDYGVAKAFSRVQDLQRLFLENVDRSKIKAVELDEPHRSTIVSFVTERRSEALASRLRVKGVYMTARGGYLRFAPRFSVTEDEVEHALRVLHELLR